MNICIGIISYLPENKKKREIRQQQLISLIDKCNEIFYLPILIVAQNWKDFKIDKKNVYTYNYPVPLQIIGARKELRQIFLNSKYDYLIMLDDDCVLSGSKAAGTKYLNEILSHPKMYGLFNSTLLKLFAISKDMFLKQDFGDGSVENGDYFEDILFVNTLIKKYPDKKFQFSKEGLSEKSNNYNDPNSTWYNGQFNKREMGDKTRFILSKI